MDPTACDGCPSYVPFVPAWTRHILWLDALVQAGCRFALNDLDVDEWRGLEILNEERARHMRAKMKESARR